MGGSARGRDLRGTFDSRTLLPTRQIPDRYREFLFKARACGLAEVEQLTQRVEIAPARTLADRVSEERDDAAGARALLQSVPPAQWGYWLRLSRELGTLGAIDALRPHQALSRLRSDYRVNMIWSGLETVLGGSIRGLSVTDIACNWAGFAIEAGLRGASHVAAFDIREANVAKARRAVAHFGLDNITCQQADLFDWSGEATDIVLNLGLMYHVSRPFEMMQKTFEMTRQVAVIDTVVHREAFSGFILGTGAAAPDHAATAIGVELHPTYRAVIDLAHIVGFRHVVELRGLPPAGWKDFAADPYGNGTRRCFVCFK